MNLTITVDISGYLFLNLFKKIYKHFIKIYFTHKSPRIFYIPGTLFSVATYLFLLW